MDEKLAPHVEEIKRALGKREIEDTSIFLDLGKLLEYRVPLEEAKRSLIKRYGGAAGVIRKLADLAPGERGVEVTGRILEVNSKVVKVKGVEKTIFSGIIADETCARSYAAWDDYELKEGEVVHITQAYARKWMSRLELNFGGRSKVTKLDNNSLPRIGEMKTLRLADLGDGAVNISTICTVLEAHQQEVATKDGVKKIISGVVADDSGKLPLTCRSIFPEIIAGNTIRIENGYVRSFRGVPTLNIGEYSRVSLEKPIKREDKPGRILMGEVMARDGAFDVIVEGNILSVRPGSGLITRCPSCNRVIQKNTCQVHGKVEGRLDLRIKAILDDGTGAMTVVLDSTLTQQISGYSIETAYKIAQAAMSQGQVEEEIRKKLLGRLLGVRGNMSKGEYGVTLVAASAWLPEASIQERAAELLGSELTQRSRDDRVGTG